MTANGIDISDIAAEFRPADRVSMRVELTDRVTQVTGTVRSDRSVKGATVVVFADEPAKWTASSRFVKTARLTDSGQFTVSGLPPHQRYLAVAVDFIEQDEAQNPDFLQRAKAAASTVLLVGRRSEGPRPAFGGSMRRELAALAVVLAALDAAAGQQAAPPRDPRTAGQAAQPAAITGRVTAAETGVPLRNAIVSAVSGMGFPREVVTDERGRFELRGLEAGAWQITVSRSGYISRKFGQSRPFGREQPIPLTAGQQVGVEIPLTRASAIVGRILDEYGEPITAARVAVLRPTMVRNRRYLEQVGEADSTDDTGTFRVHSLPAGEYFVTASARLAPPESVVQTTLSPTFYPGTADFALAQKVRVTSGGEASVDFALLPVRTARLSGFVTTSEGRPAEAFLSLAADAIDVGMSFGSGGITRDDGTFTMADIRPGPTRSSPRSVPVQVPLLKSARRRSRSPAPMSRGFPW